MTMKKQSNINRKSTESAEYYAGTIELNGVETKVLFTEHELKRPVERAQKQPEDFPGSGGLGIFSTIAGWFK
jgi:hypothetical protein